MRDYYKERISEIEKRIKEEFIDDDIKIDLLKLELFRIKEMIKDKLIMIQELEDNISCLEYDDLFDMDESDSLEKEEELRFKDLIRRSREIVN
ncbi:TPA: hypothetical protein NKQ07_001306 [Vibrio parahaemolyticus]|nr:hypothetical protein [Vibrio parahaemolyticus]